MRVDEVVPLLEPNDYVLWQKKKICKVLERLPKGPAFMKIPPAHKHIEITPYGMTKEEHARLCDDAARFRVRDENTEEEFEADGHDLLYVNPMLVLGVMGQKKDGEDDSSKQTEG